MTSTAVRLSGVGPAWVCAGADFPHEHVNPSGAMLGVRKLYTTRHG